MPVTIKVLDDPQRVARRRKWSLVCGISALCTIFLVGAVGFRLIEGSSWTWIDAVYMTVITMSTVGFEEVKPLSPAGRIFTIGVIVMGVGAFAFTVAALGERLISGQLVESLRQRNTERMLKRMRGHVIVVGYGNTGSLAAAQLQARHKEHIVVIDIDEELVRNASEDGFIGVHGDAGKDEVLEAAGIAKAKSMLCALAPDSVVLMTVLTAHVMAPNLHIVARATLPEAEAKLIRAGASRVVSVHHIAASRMADEMMAYPDMPLPVASTIEVEGQKLPLSTGEVRIDKGSKFVGRRIGESGIMSGCKADIAAVKLVRSGELADPSDDLTLQPGDTLILVGTPQHVDDAVSSLTATQS